MISHKVAIILFVLFCQGLQASESVLHEKIFGEKEHVQVLLLEVYEEGRFIGEVEASLSNQQLVSFQKMDLLILFREILEAPAYKKLSALEGPVIRPEQLPFSISYDPTELILRLEVPQTSRRAKRLSFAPAVSARTRAQALKPAPLSGALTFRAEQTFNDSSLQEDFFQSSFDSFLNLNSVVLENRSDYNSSASNEWSRGDTRVVYDNEKTQVRYQVGDIGNQVIGVQPFRQLGGISISRNFGLNPYRANLPSGSQEFNLRTRSQVNTYINGALVKTEFLEPGRYSLDNLPLNNGLNKIVVEAFDELGGREVFEFQQSSSLTLLNPKESRFDFSLGHEYEEVEREREYQTDKPLVFSTFYQYGLSAEKTAGVYFQKQGKFNVSGVEGTWAFPLGLISSGLAFGKNSTDGGLYFSTTYQLTTLGREWSDYQRLALTYEYRDESFQQNEIFTKNKLASLYRLQYSQPLSSIITANLGLSYADIREAQDDRYGYEMGLSSRLTNRISLSVLGGRNRDEMRNWNEQLYVFMTISFPHRGAYAQTLYNSQNQSTRLTVSNDSLNRIHSLKTQTSVERNLLRDEVQADVTYIASFADIGARGEIRQAREQSAPEARDSKKIGLKLASTFAFASDSQGAVFDMTRPVSNSFAFLRPDEDFENPLNVRGVGIYNEASLGPFGNTIYPNMIPYQYREIEVDAAYLPEGISLEKENFILYPRYRSGHLLRLATIGEKAITLNLLDEKGRVLSFAVGSVDSRKGQKLDFFTNKEGRVFVNGLSPGDYFIKLEGQELALEITIPDSDNVRIDLGTLQMKRGLE